MTHDEGQELLNVLMDATSRVVGSRLSDVAKVVFGTVRFVDGGAVYVRQSTDMSTPRVASPASIADLDDGDVLLPNISGQALAAGDDVEVTYTRSIADGVITRKPGASTSPAAERSVYARLATPGWYRAIKIANEGRGGMGFVIDINITRSYSNASNEAHTIKLLGCWNNFVFTHEAGRSNMLRVSKIRYTRDSSNNGYVDIYFNSSNWENVSVDFVPHTQSDYIAGITAETLQAVADAPSGETIATTYNLAANTEGYLSVSNSHITARFYSSGSVKSVYITDPKGLTTGAVTTLVAPSDMSGFLPTGSYVQDCVSMDSTNDKVRIYVDAANGIRAYNYSSNTSTINLCVTITYV